MMAEKERGFLDVVEDSAANMIDSLASGRRGLAVLGAGLAGALNTDGFREKKLKLANAYAESQRAQERHKASMERHKALMERNAVESGRDTERHAADMKQRALSLETGELRNQAMQLNIDRAYERRESEIIHNNIQNVLKNDPAYGWGEFNTEEQKAVMSSPAVQQMAKGTYIIRELLRSRKDPEAWGRVQRMVENNGGTVEGNAKDGFKVNMFGRQIPLNEQQGQLFHTKLQQTLLEEVNARRAISYNSTKGNVLGKIQAAKVQELIPFTDGSAVKATDVFKKTLSGLSDNQKYIMVARKTIEDYFNKTVSNEEKTAEAEMVLAQDKVGMSMLNKMGFSFNAGNNNMADATIVNNSTRQTYSIPEFLEYLKEHDEGGRIFDLQKQSLEKIAVAKIALANRRRNSNMWDGTEAKPPVVNDDDKELGKRIYGEDFGLADTDEQRRLISTYNQIVGQAKKDGILENKNGQYVLSSKATDDDLKRFVDMEKLLYKNNKLADYASSGLIHQLVAREKHKKVIADAGKFDDRNRKINQEAEKIIRDNGTKDMSWWEKAVRTLGAAEIYRTLGERGMAGRSMKGAAENSKKTIERIDKRLKQDQKKKKSDEDKK